MSEGSLRLTVCVFASFVLHASQYGSDRRLPVLSGPLTWTRCAYFIGRALHVTCEGALGDVNVYS